MRNTALLVVAALALAACGGGNKENVSRYRGGAPATLAKGPISKACLQADRKAANLRLCGCVQAVANGSLSKSDQKLAASFFRDPHKAQVIRQSDNTGNEAFWKRYKAFAAKSGQVCKGY